MKNIKFKRIMAYLIDYLVITLLATLLSQVKVLNPHYEEYTETYQKYQEMYKEISNDTNMISQLNDDLNKTMYEVSYYGASYTAIEFSVILLYFTFFPLLFSGQTIGKRIAKIKIVHKDDDKELNILNYLIRAALVPIFATGLFYCSITLIGNFASVLLLNQGMFIKFNKVFLLIGLAWGYADAIYGISRSNDRTLHDYIANTKVIEIINN